MKLTKGIYYFDCTDFVYLRNVKLAKDYLFNSVRLHQVYCHVMANNEASIRLFRRAGFSECGRLRQWMRTREGFVDVWVLQCINE